MNGMTARRREHCRYDRKFAPTAKEAAVLKTGIHAPRCHIKVPPLHRGCSIGSFQTPGVAAPLIVAWSP